MQKRSHLRIFSVGMLIVLVLSMVSCDKEEPIPSYIFIPSFTVDAQPEFGTSTSKITEAWVYANNDLLGVFPIPATVPILETGATDIRIFPGIHEAGILSRPTIYPFYEPILLNHVLTAGKIDTLPLVTKYLSSDKIKLELNITFDIGNVLTDDLDDDSTTFVKIIPEGAEGPGGQLMVRDTAPNLSVGNNSLFHLPTNGSQVYIEMEYHNDVKFSVWMRGHKSINQGDIKPIATLNEKEEWNKIYIPLTEFLQSNKWLDYQFVLNVKLTDNEIASGIKEGKVVVDNIKIVRYK
ncbi:MAG TPA: hypothetical protein ENK85_09170 [Saprospiraceae bacterium]|nr:hypothetical protein [Saprospiraceae bacterium]